MVLLFVMNPISVYILNISKKISQARLNDKK